MPRYGIRRILSSAQSRRAARPRVKTPERSGMIAASTTSRGKVATDTAVCLVGLAITGPQGGSPTAPATWAAVCLVRIVVGSTADVVAVAVRWCWSATVAAASLEVSTVAATTGIGELPPGAVAVAGLARGPAGRAGALARTGLATAKGALGSERERDALSFKSGSSHTVL